ncbi:MAG: hypothetical protein RIR97_2010 [Pseudomonadota bacterium]
MSLIAEKLSASVERIMAPWLPRSVTDIKLRPKLMKAFRYVLMLGTASFVLLPLALSTLASPAVALPAGVAIAAAATLISALAVLATMRNLAQPFADAEDDALHGIEARLYDYFPGLVTLHDPRGFVTSIHGRDRTSLLPRLQDVMGMGFLEMVHVSDRLQFLQAVDRLRQGAMYETVNLRFEKLAPARGAQQFVHVRTDLAALRNSHGDLTGLIAQSIDISEMEKLRDDASSHSLDIRTAHEAKTRFLAAVSHELRTPLNAILGFSDILKTELFGPLANEQQREYVALIHHSGHHLLSVVNTMLDMSKIEAGRYEVIAEPFELYPAVESCVAMLDLQARVKGVVLANRVLRTAGDLTADQRAIKQILINLVGNAIKFTDTGGVVTVDLEQNDDSVTLVISDTGIGISPAMLTKVGQPFMQVQNDLTRNYEGTGLGLSLVKGLVALHGGDFVMTSEEKKGTVVRVSLPRDGSGIRPADNGLEAESQSGTVEFPPRLTASAASKTSHKDTRDDRSPEAKSA